MNRLHDILVIGTGGLTKQCLPLILKTYKNPAFFNDTDKEINYFYNGGFYIYHSVEFIRIADRFIVCVSNPNDRKILTDKFKKFRKTPMDLVSEDFPNKINADYGNGRIILGQCLIENGVELGESCLINTRCSIHHDSHIGQYTTLSPNVIVLGDCEIGDFTFIGAGAIIKEKTKVGSNSIIGMGSIVLNDVPDNEVWVGNPAKFIRKK